MRRLGPLLGAAFLIVGFVYLGRRRYARIAVSGHSMEPALRDGDWLLIDRGARAGVGDVVVARDPREPARVIIKRVTQETPDSRLVLASDHLGHADETIGSISSGDVLGRAVLRYWPPPNIGSIR